MNENVTKSRRFIMIMVMVAGLPFFLAWVLMQNPQWITSRSNYGTLVVPPVTTKREQFQGADLFSKQNIGELKGHWILINLVFDADCSETCQQAIHSSKQIRLMMNKDLVRLRRMVVVTDRYNREKGGDWWQRDNRLLKVIADESITAKLKRIIDSDKQQGQLLVMDPLGNIMLFYNAGFDPYGVKKDLKKLLRASQIG
jgi:hypothetical protein